MPHNFEIALLPKLIIFFCFRKLSDALQNIEKGKHRSKKCAEYCKEYKEEFGQELPPCKYKGSKSKIQNLIRKIHIDKTGIATEINFGDKNKMCHIRLI